MSRKTPIKMTDSGISRLAEAAILKADVSDRNPQS